MFVLLKGSYILFLIYEMDFDVSLSQRDFFSAVHLLYQLSALLLENEKSFLGERNRVVFSIEFQCVICI